MTTATSYTRPGGRGDDDHDDRDFTTTITVLLVDDDEAFVDLIADYLEREHGFEAHTTTSPAEALEYLETDGVVDCIVSDYQMPGTDGLELLETVKARYPAIPFVMFAGQGSEEIASQAIQRGADDYLQKDTGEARYDLLANRIRNCVTIARQQRQLNNLYAAIEDAGHAMIVTDRQGVITYANPTMMALTGYDAEELLGETPALFNSGEHDEAFYEELWETIQSGGVWEGEVVNERKDGSQFVIDQTIAPITDDEDNVEGFVAINRDVTDRKQRERELRQFRNAVEHAGHIVLITDTDGTIEYANSAFEEATGYDREEVIGETPALFNSGEHDEAFYEELWNTIRSGEVWEGEVVNERKDGSQYVIDQTISPITDEEGTVEGFVAINQDITQLKQYEQELEEQNKRLKEYGQTVAHDLRNPLTLLEGELEMLRTTADEADDRLEPTRVEKQCSNIAEVVDRMRTLIDDLLTMAEQGQLVLDPDEVPLEGVAREAWEQVGPKKIDLSAEETDIQADPDRLRELLSNLLRNAIEHAGENARVWVGPLDGSNGFYVEDDGPGIPEAERGRVFDRGFTTADEGTGFGLAIVEQIAQAHGWTVSVTEGRAGGARFEFRVKDVT